ncbi:MAG: DUF805 domain-containing protein [Erythrobacteraceae bacterium]|nr:DUF805 domain-containing protein [Erythrobacteraceae bacterium]|tara:strand:+ start:66 stop:611 length:546 start_codon:yes stop_codon:yes gene_type:complete
MGEAIKHGFANLTNFSGRDSRSLFWWWVLLIVVVTFALSFISGIVFMAGSMGGAFQAGAAGVDQQQIQAEMMRNMAGSLETQAWIGVAISVLGLFLLIASFVRRLRDAGLPVLIAIIPVITTTIAAYASVSAVDEIRELMMSDNAQALNEAATSGSGLGLVAYIGYLVVIICGLIPTRNAD